MMRESPTESSISKETGPMVLTPTSQDPAENKSESTLDHMKARGSSTLVRQELEMLHGAN